MAYLAFQDLGGSPASRALSGSATPAAGHGVLSALEWTVVALARHDGLASLRPAGWLARLLAPLGERRKPRLADDRLEALRRLAVLTWADGAAVPPHEIAAFFAAGFDERQYQAMVERIGASRTLPPRTIGLAA